MANQESLKARLEQYNLDAWTVDQVLAQCDDSASDREIRRVIRNIAADRALHNRR